MKTRKRFNHGFSSRLIEQKNRTWSAVFLTRLPLVLALALPLLVGCSELDGNSNDPLGLRTTETGNFEESFSLEDPVDQVEEDDPTKQGGPPETDIAKVTVGSYSNLKNTLKVAVRFHGDLAAWYATQSWKLPFSLQIWTNDGSYTEAFFKEKDEMKTSENTAPVWFEINGEELCIRLGGIKPKDIKKVRVSTFQAKPGVGNGRYVDELVIER